jgi:hypothetical protein
VFSGNNMSMVANPSIVDIGPELLIEGLSGEEYLRLTAWLKTGFYEEYGLFTRRVTQGS